LYTKSNIQKRHIYSNLIVALLLIFTTQVNAQQRILVLGWNVESGGNDPETISKQLADYNGYDIIGLYEVMEENAELYAMAAAVGEGSKGSDKPVFQYIVGKTGRSDRMMIIWDAKRFDLVGDPVEITDLQFKSYRAPFYAQFKLKNSEVEFLFMVNHLARGKSDIRQKQAAGLVIWAKNQILPIIAVGDYNFDYDVDDGAGNDAMNIFLEDDTFTWVRPLELYKTSASPGYNGVLDFMFVSNAPDNWQIDSKILAEGLDFIDYASTSDHRPIHGRLLIYP